MGAVKIPFLTGLERSIYQYMATIIRGALAEGLRAGVSLSTTMMPWNWQEQCSVGTEVKISSLISHKGYKIKECLLEIRKNKQNEQLRIR
jgi:hypothetical protein